MCASQPLTDAVIAADTSATSAAVTCGPIGRLNTSLLSVSAIGKVRLRNSA